MRIIDQIDVGVSKPTEEDADNSLHRSEEDVSQSTANFIEHSFTL